MNLREMVTSSRVEVFDLGSFLHDNHKNKVSLHRLFVDLTHIGKELQGYENAMQKLQQLERKILTYSSHIDQQRQQKGMIGQSDSLLLAVQATGKILAKEVFSRSAPISINVWTNCDRAYNPDIYVKIDLTPARALRLKLDKKFKNSAQAQVYLHANERDFTLNLTQMQGGVWKSNPIEPNQKYELQLIEIKDAQTVRVYSKTGRFSQLEKAKIELKELKINELAAFLAKK